MQIVDIIKYDGNDNNKQWLIYKYPSDEFVLGSQLIVNQGQEALFFRGGQALDLFGAGTHTLSTANLPLLNNFVKILFGGKTPFTAEVYFINKTVNLNMKWGTSTQIPIEDSKYGLILNIMARGQYGIIIKDSKLFVSRIIGAIPLGTQKDFLLISRYFNTMINTKVKSVISNFMISNRISFLEISQYLYELSEVFKTQIEMEFERFAIELLNFYCEAIGPHPNEYQKLKQFKEEKLFQNITSDFILKKCPICGKENSNNLNFCGYCGNRL